MKCLNQGQLLLYLEKELPLEQSRHIEAHLAECPLCSRTLKEAVQQLEFTRTRMNAVIDSVPAIPVYGQEDAWQYIDGKLKRQKKGAFIMQFRKMAIAAAVVIALVLVGSNPAAQTVAANFLKVFRVQKVETINLTPNDMASIEKALQKGNTNINLENFGQFQTTGKAERSSIKYEDLARLDFAVKLPDQLNQAETAYYLQKSPELTYIPDIQKANAFIKSLGSDDLLPDSLDQQPLRITAGDNLEIHTKEFVLMQGPTPELEAPEGVNVDEVARAMVALPIWPENIRQQLDAVNDWEHTLLIPGENSQKVSINGQDGVLMENNHSKVLIWQENGILYTLYTLGADQTDIVSVARSLR